MSETLPELTRLKTLCPMRSRVFGIGELELTIWTACDMDPLLDRLLEKEEAHPDRTDERMPYWAELWPSSILMAEVISRHFPRLPEGPWLELGCGPALPSVTAAALGRNGFATDYLEEARWLAALNLKQNGCGDRVQVAELDWRAPWDQRFNWILAGDIAYEDRNFDPILRCWDRMLAPDGEIWLGEPGRSVAKEFFRKLASAGWRTEIIGEKERVAVHRITRHR